MDPTLLRQFAIALGLGLLVGLQRERAASGMAGIRTFALITWFGAVTAELAGQVGGWVVGAGLLALAALVVTGHVARVHAHEGDSGITTEVAVVLMYVVGAFVVLGDPLVAVVLTGGVALLLHWKTPLHAFVRQIGEDDFAAIMRFVLITLVILPVVPDEPLGPYGVLNPFNVWLMVVLIVGIGLAGYLVHKLAGARFGPLLNGILGGLVSSTATTASYARRSVADADHAAIYSLVIAIASCVMFARVGIEIAVVAPTLLASAWMPLTATFTAALFGALLLARRNDPEGYGKRDLSNPAELWPAVGFGALYATVLVASAFVRERFGDAGVYALALVGGLTDVDAITLSTARLSEQGRLDSEAAWRAILLASLANLLFKGGIVITLGRGALARRLAVAFLLPLAVGVVLVLWP